MTCNAVLCAVIGLLCSLAAWICLIESHGQAGPDAIAAIALAGLMFLLAELCWAARKREAGR